MPPHPDQVRSIKRWMQTGMDWFGQPVTLRKYISASAGNPEFGIADKLCYQPIPTNMEFSMLNVEEMQAIGGVNIQGAFSVVSILPITLRDEIIYMGETYRLIGQPEVDTVSDAIYWRGIAQRASITGFY